MKRCKVCSQTYPETLDNFYKVGNGLSALCKECYKARSRKRHHVNADAIATRKKEKYLANPDPSKLRTREWTESNRERKRQMDHDYRVNNRDKIVARQKEWDENNHDMTLATKSRYRARKRGLPADFTADDWQQCLEYWDHRCCICGKPLGIWHIIIREHWIPVTDKRVDNPGTVVWNILPMCHSIKGGEGGCNNVKNNKTPETWLISFLGKKRAVITLERIYTYFSLMKDRKGVK